MSKIKNNADKHYEELLKGTGRGAKNIPKAGYEAMYNVMFRKLHELSMNRFTWQGLPDTIDQRYLEKTLLEQGLAVFFKSEKYGVFHALQAAHSNPDYQLNPTYFRITATGAGFINETVTDKDAVPIWGNYSRTPDLDIIYLYAQRLAYLDRTIDINLGNARQPKILQATTDTRLTNENIYRDIEQGQPVIRVQEGATMPVSVLDMSIDPNLFEKVSLARTRIWNECMGLLGIKHANQDKKERLVTDEVAANDEQISYMKATALNSRKQACERINSMFDLDITVEYSDDLEADVFTDLFEDIEELTDDEEEAVI